MRALCRLREGEHYGKGVFDAGLRAVGFEVVPQLKPAPGDLFVTWGRQGGYDEEAGNFERAGARLLVVENPYVKPDAGKWFSVSLSQHGGAGTWPDGGPQRWDSWGIELAPWREGSEVVILGQRSMGSSEVRSPPMWAEKLHKRLPGSRIRPHPGPQKTGMPLVDDLRHASAVATWASSAGLLALMAGVPVFCDFPRWIGAAACRSVDELLTGADPLRDDAARLAMFQKLAWAQWSLEEIRSGKAIRCLLEVNQS